MDSKKPVNIFDEIAALFRFDSSGQTLSPDRGNMAIDYFPGVANVGEPGVNEFHAPAPDVPAYPVETETLMDVLKDIRENTRKPPKNPVFFTEVFDIPAVAGEKSVRIQNPFKYLTVSRAPRDLNVFAGEGKAYFLATLPEGKTLTAELPFEINGVTIEWGEAVGETGQIVVIMASEETVIRIT